MSWLIFNQVISTKNKMKKAVINLNNVNEIIYYNKNQIIVYLKNSDVDTIYSQNNSEQILEHIINRLKENKPIIDIRRLQKLNGDNGA